MPSIIIGCQRTCKSIQTSIKGQGFFELNSLQSAIHLGANLLEFDCTKAFESAHAHVELMSGIVSITDQKT